MKKLINYLIDWQKNGSYNQNFLLSRDKVLNFSQNGSESLTEYLKLLTPSELFPREFIQNRHIDAQTVVYILGLYLYFIVTKEKFTGRLEHINIKKVGIYQFLLAVLKPDPSKRKSNITYLLELLNKEEEESVSKKFSMGYVDEFSTVGLVRDINQDYMMSVELARDITLLIVADGMGGGEDGDIASRLAVNTSYNYLKKQSFDEIKGSEIEILDSKEKRLKNQKYRQEIHEKRQNFLIEAIAQANAKIVEYAQQKNINSIGSTLSIALVIKEDVYIGHIGDSRIYHKHKKDSEYEYKLVSKDQSQVAMLIEKGAILEEDSDKYPQNILMYVLGTDSFNKSIVYINHITLNYEDKLLLASDGFWDKISKEKFDKKFPILIKDIFNAVPNDNATVQIYSHVLRETTVDGNDFDDRESQYCEKKEDKKYKKIILKIVFLIILIIVGFSITRFYLDISSNSDSNKTDTNR